MNPAGLAAGEYKGSITFSDPAASNSPQTVEVNLKVFAPGESKAPFGDFATPIDGTTGITGVIPVTGWVVDDVEVLKVEIWRDPVPSAGEIDSLYYIGDGIFVEGARPDVETDYPGYPMNYRAGWGYMLLTNFLPAQGNGTFKLYAVVTDEEKNVITLGTKTIVCDNAHAVKPFGTIDTPAQGGDASGNPFLNFGWVLTPLPKTVPTDGSMISVYVDSVLVGTLVTAPNVYNQYRADVATNFPGLNNTGAPGVGGPVGAYLLDTTGYENGVHTIYWVAYDDAGAGDGIGSRYFNIVNTGASPVPANISLNLQTESEPSKANNLKVVPKSYKPISLKTGIDLKTQPSALLPDQNGVYRVAIPEVNFVEIDLDVKSEADRIEQITRHFGYMIMRDELRPLPIGSTLDARTGRFSWMPGPGFIGAYDLIFVEKDGEVPLRTFIVRIDIRPKFL